MLGSLRAYCRAVERNGDSYEAWMGLSALFEAMDDRDRSGRCRGIATHLLRDQPAGAAARG